MIGHNHELVGAHMPRSPGDVPPHLSDDYAEPGIIEQTLTPVGADRDEVRAV
jgi:hypothetical protein